MSDSPPARSSSDEQTLQALLHLQNRELDVRTQEFSLRGKQLDNNSAHAEKMLAAQERDRIEQRKHERGVQLIKLIGWGVLLFALLAFAIYGMYLDKEAMVKDVLQIIVGAVVGALGGYGYGKSKPKD